MSNIACCIHLYIQTGNDSVVALFLWNRYNYSSLSLYCSVKFCTYVHSQFKKVHFWKVCKHGIYRQESVDWRKLAFTSICAQTIEYTNVRHHARSCQHLTLFIDRQITLFCVKCSVPTTARKEIHMTIWRLQLQYTFRKTPLFSPTGCFANIECANWTSTASVDLPTHTQLKAARWWWFDMTCQWRGFSNTNASRGGTLVVVWRYGGTEFLN